jgi:hypothetical protein
MHARVDGVCPLYALYAPGSRRNASAVSFLSCASSEGPARPLARIRGIGMRARTITVSMAARTGVAQAEFHIDTGRLRIVESGLVRVELFPPHSWFSIASAAGKSRWGTRPVEADLRRVLESYVAQRTGSVEAKAEVDAREGGVSCA